MSEVKIDPRMVGLDARYLREEARMFASIVEFGASPENSPAENFAAIQATLDALETDPRGGGLWVPGKKFDSNGELIFNPSAADSLTFRGIEGASKINIRTGTFGMRAHMNFGRVVNDGVSWEATDVAAGFTRMLDIRSDDIMGASMRNFSITRLGSTPTFIGILAERLRESSWYNLDIQTGEAASYGVTGIGIQMQGELGVGEGTTHVFDQVKVRSTGKAVVLRPTGTHAGGGNIEGVRFVECDFVGVDQGVDCEGVDDLGNGYLAPLFTWTGGHINATGYGLIFKNVAQAKIFNADIYIDSSGPDGAQAGILMDKVIRGKIVNSDIAIIDQLAGGSLNNIVGISIDGASQKISVRGNNFGLTGDSNGLLIGASVTKCRYGSNTLEKVTAGVGAVVSNLGGASNVDEGNNTNIAA